MSEIYYIKKGQQYLYMMTNENHPIWLADKAVAKPFGLNEAELLAEKLKGEIVSGNN